MARVPTSDEELADGMRSVFRYYLHRRDPAEVAPLLSGTIYSASARTQGFAAVARWSSVDRLGAITTPTLVLVGRHDVVTSWPQSVRIASRIPTPSWWSSRSGHTPWLDEPDRFFEIVGGWLDRIEHGNDRSIDR